MDKLGPCAECTEIQASLANSFQMTSLNESDGIPRHILIYLCSNGDMFQAVPVQRCSSEVVANALKEVEAVQVKVSAALSEVCAKLKESEIRLKQMGLSKTASQESLSSTKRTARSNSQQSLCVTPGRSLDSLTTTPRKYGISASLSKLKTNNPRKCDQLKPARLN
ncbi:uncharacterized protein [Rhodnius prolixus]|uniref:Uncharacterized protein n=1 Tax=Rhodnius prolixus TaxID=13249 RepID=T1I7K5_RHOPR